MTLADTAFLVILFLVFVYLGMEHILILFLGAFTLITGIYDLRTGKLSAWLRGFFSWPARMPQERRLANAVPLLVSMGLVIYGVYRLTEYGFVNTGQGELMRGDHFVRFTFLFAGISLLMSTILALLHIRK